MNKSNSSRSRSEPRLEAALNSWPCWSVELGQKPSPSEKLAGGLTNESWLIETDAGPAVLRLNNRDSRLLGIDRRREAAILAVASRAGLAPAVWCNDPDRGFLVTCYIQGRHWHSDEFRQAGKRTALKSLVRRLQELPLALPRFDYLAHLDVYWAAIGQRELAVPPSLIADWERWRPAIADFQQGDWCAVPCHHDLSPLNIIDRGDRVFLVDWEYSAAGHPAVDYAALGSGHRFSEWPVVSAVIALMESFWFLLRESPDFP